MRLGRMRDGWERCRTSGQTKREPITSNILKQFLSLLSSNDRDHQTLRAILCFAKFGLLRVSEYTYGSNCFGPKVKNLAIFPDMENPEFMVYTFNKSKCNQFGKTERTVCVCTCPNPCAVHETIRMLNLRKVSSSEENLFEFSGKKLPTARQINQALKNLCRILGLDITVFRSHQLRSGGVVDHLCAGVPDSVVQEIARWANADSMIPYKKLSAKNIADILRK